MPVLGRGGTLLLRRELPEAIVLPETAIHALSKSIVVSTQAYWSGDEVRLTCDRGLPMDRNSDTYADCPDGHGTYAEGIYPLGPNKSHLTSDSSSWYTNSGSAKIYATASAVGQTQAITAFIYRDQLDRISFYTNRTDAINGTAAARIPLIKLACGPLILSPSGSTDYESALLDCSGDLGDYQYSDIQDEVTLASLCDYAPTYLLPEAGTAEYDNADALPRSSVGGTPWQFQGWMQNWTLNLTAQEQDTTTVGDKYGSAIKALVTGGGSADFLIERQSIENGQDSTALLQLLLLIEKGCKAEARFNLIVDKTYEVATTYLEGSLYYQTEILITRSAVNTRADDIIAGSIDFITTGAILLKMGNS